MPRRRNVMVPALAAAATLWAVPTAGAATRTVLAGGPPPTASQRGGLTFDPALDLNGFFSRRVTIHVGDTVKWVFSQRVVHTVTFLAPGTPVPTLETQDATHPYTGVKDAAGNDFWYDGKAPSIVIPPDHAGPVGGATTDGTTYHNSGLSAPAFKPYTLTFTHTGTFHYLCLVHPGMTGTVRVVKRGRRVPTAHANRRAAIREMRHAISLSRHLARFHPKGNRVVAAHDKGVVSWFRFFPAVRQIKVGQSVTFSISSKSEIHTVTFGPETYRDNLEQNLIVPQPFGLTFNPQIFLPSDQPLPAYDGTNHGNGYFNTGIMDTNPQSPVPPSNTVTFTKAGTYVFECTIHPGMEGTIKVT